MEITYELTPDDLWHLTLYYRRHKALALITFYYVLGAFLILFSFWPLWTAFELWTKARRVDLVSVFFSCLIFYLTTRFIPLTKARTLKVMTKKMGAIGEHTVSISPEWFAEKTPVTDIKNAWVTIESIEEDKTHFFFFLSKTLAFIIPKRAFSSPATAQAFLNKSRRYWDAAKSGTPVAAEDEAV